MPENQKLPYDLLLIIFSFLPVPDGLVNVQRVCSGWRAAAQHKSLWKNFKLTLSGTPEDERKLRTMPALRNIDGTAGNHFLDIILENVTELVQMNCIFKPSLSALQVQCVIHNYPRMESLTLDMLAPDILESVNILKTSKSLKVLNFTVLCYDTGDDSNDNTDTNMLASTFLKTYNVFADDKNFPALTNIDFFHNYTFLRRSFQASFNAMINVMTDIIRKRCQQLLSLKVAVGNSDSNFMNAINMCKRLHTLKIALFQDDPSDPPTCLNMAGMTELRLLHMQAWNSSGSINRILCDTFYRGSWKHLSELEMCVSNESHLDIFRSVIENMKHLRKLIYYDDNANTNEMELEKINCLYQLETLQVNGMASISEDGINFLLQCTKNLRSLMLAIKKTNVSDFHQCIAKVIKPMKLLKHLNILMMQSMDSVLCNDRDAVEAFISKTICSLQ